jgi:hypothetical protein
MAKRPVFAVISPLGHCVVLTRDRWREIVRYKHPALTGHDSDVQECLLDPDLIRSRVNDPDTHLYYRTLAEGTLCVVVGGEDTQQRFVITAYFTQSLKKARFMDKVRVYHDRTGNTVTVWFDNPRREAICEEIGDDVVLIKDKEGRVIGFERLNYLAAGQRGRGGNVPVEVHVL